MNTLKKLFAYLLIVLFISIFFQSIVILFIKYSKEEPGVALTQKFQNTFLNTGDKDKKDGASGAGHLLKTLSNVVSTLSEQRDGTDPDKMVISVQRSSQIEEYRPQTELNSPFFEEKIELKPVKISSQQASSTPAAGASGEAVDIPYGKKIIFHTLSRGEKLSDLARLYSVPLETIKKMNGFSDNYRLFAGQKIMIVQTSENTAQNPAEEKRTQAPAQTAVKNSGGARAVDEENEIDGILRSSKSAKTVTAKINAVTRQDATAAASKKTGSKIEKTSSKEIDPLSDIIKSAKNKRRVFKWPVRGAVTSKFGMRIHPVYGKSAMHTGVDIGARKGRPIKPAMGGTVVFAGWLGGYGKMVEIKHPKGYVTRYAHMSAIKVKKGQSVNSSTAIGAVGDTGTSTGYHLHFEVRKYGRPLNPLAFIRN